MQVRALRAGTAGDVSAGVIVDPLITTTAAAAARAIHAMASTRPRQLVDLDLPLFAAGGSTPGVIEPGQLVMWSGAEEFRAVTTGCRIAAQRSGPQLTIRQNLTVERHLDFP